MRLPKAVKLVRQAIGDPDGRCYPAAEAVWHLIGGPRSSWRPAWVRTGRLSTLMNRHTRAICDPTCAQFTVLPDYAAGACCGFLTTKPSKRTQAILDRVRKTT